MDCFDESRLAEQEYKHPCKEKQTRKEHEMLQRNDPANVGVIILAASEEIAILENRIGDFKDCVVVGVAWVLRPLMQEV